MRHLVAALTRLAIEPNDPGYRPHPHGMSNQEFSDWHNQGVEDARRRDSANLPAFARGLLQLREGSPETLRTWREDGERALANDPLGDPELRRLVQEALEQLDQGGVSWETRRRLQQALEQAPAGGLDNVPDTTHLGAALSRLAQDLDSDVGGFGESAPCPACGSDNEPMGTLGRKKHYNCRSCGMYYSNDHDTFETANPPIAQHGEESGASVSTHLDDGRDVSVGGPAGPRHDAPPRM